MELGNNVHKVSHYMLHDKSLKPPSWRYWDIASSLRACSLHVLLLCNLHLVRDMCLQSNNLSVPHEYKGGALDCEAVTLVAARAIHGDPTKRAERHI
jgi:hypothetical protein